jgi:hypothetical protein
MLGSGCAGLGIITSNYETGGSFGHDQRSEAEDEHGMLPPLMHGHPQVKPMRDMRLRDEPFLNSNAAA